MDTLRVLGLRACCSRPHELQDAGLGAGVKLREVLAQGLDGVALDEVAPGGWCVRSMSRSLAVMRDWSSGRLWAMRPETAAAWAEGMMLASSRRA